MSEQCRILLIDNYDSFTCNLQHLIQVHSDVVLTVRRNDQDFLSELERGVYAGVVIGPGPGSPEDPRYFGHNQEVILRFGVQGLPVLGVCLGFQGIYRSFGGCLKVAALPMHGKVSRLDIRESGVLLQNVPSGARVMRYHSIMADLTEPAPDCLHLTAFTCSDSTENSIMQNGVELMALEHSDHPIFGLQFHPESFATEFGDRMVRNFLRVCQ